MLPTLIIATLIAGSIIYFFFYQIWPRPHTGSSVRIRSDRYFLVVYRYLQFSTPIYAGLALANYQLPWPLAIGWLGLGLSTTSVGLFVWSMVSLREQYSHCFDSYVPQTLVERGPYRWVRHPIYTANCLAFAGLFLATGSIGVLVNGGILAIFYYRAACWEEATLVLHLPGYAGYLVRTGRFFPRPLRLMGSLMSLARLASFSVIACLAVLGGCAVPQPPGKGAVSHQDERITHSDYWLYLPTDYEPDNETKRWPLVVTFHGTKPFDTSYSQIREWQQEADRYGFIVIAPDLRTPDVFMQFPLRDPKLPYLRHDDKAIMAMMDKVFAETRADPSRVLATGWSTGGYIAHYIVNRHPERFSCLAVRESPFSEGLLDPAQVSKYQNMKVAIYFGENDFPVCRTGSQAALEWYRAHGFNVEAKIVQGAGHERIPDTVADFFAASIGVSPKSPGPHRSVVKEVVASKRRRPQSVSSAIRRRASSPDSY
ncbi:MAG TPA: methyltransferase [Phycisphaerae bacterium]|nr:methyltransferase [Phycisphaerae bacterium]